MSCSLLFQFGLFLQGQGIGVRNKIILPRRSPLAVLTPQEVANLGPQERQKGKLVFQFLSLESPPGRLSAAE
jgi:hypothetical protein